VVLGAVIFEQIFKAEEGAMRASQRCRSMVMTCSKPAHLKI